MSQAQQELPAEEAAKQQQTAEQRQRFTLMQADVQWDITNAFTGLQQQVRVVERRLNGDPIVVSIPLQYAVLDAIDLSVVSDHLIVALRQSQCPLVRRLREAIIEAHVAKEMRGLL